jgi:hypothetical protein
VNAPDAVNVARLTPFRYNVTVPVDADHDMATCTHVPTADVTDAADCC